MQYLSTLSAAGNPQKVYGLDKNVTDFGKLPGSVECFGTQRVIPHITIGLAKGWLLTK